MVFSTQENSSLPNPEQWREQPELCSKCGKCRAVCPVFRETQAEPYVARGRLALIGAIERGELPADGATFTDALSMCLSCYRCGARYRGPGVTQRHEAFNLETHEKHRQIAARGVSATLPPAGRRETQAPQSSTE